MAIDTPDHVLGIIIPSYRQVRALPEILAHRAVASRPVLIVDDGNTPALRRTIAELGGRHANVEVLHRETNGGKGKAVTDGMLRAFDRGWTHALQIDADGQHDLESIAALAALSREHPAAVISGIPQYDDTIPAIRKAGRELTHFWVRIHTLGNAISDSMCGFRVYPLATTTELILHSPIGARMDFDTDIIVRLYWQGLDVVEHPVGVTYPSENVSNFRMFRDNVRITLMHTRLALQMPVRMPLRWYRDRVRLT
ncbi:MAG: family 2 glycosyl transferase [Gammaproteobacteria bacterium]|nr:MAG: family 2 glycosyl transferase [Gammaproteobacteria bacterium]